MNKNIMILWGSCVLSICIVLVMIGYKLRDNDLINIKKELKNKSLIYLKDNNISLKYNETTIIFTKELLEKEYIKDDKLIYKYCFDSITITKKLFTYNFIFNYNCEKKTNISSDISFYM